jgi:hypothetical protein
VGGVVALALLFGGAGAYVLLTGSPGFMGPSEVGAGEASAGIAVLPFEVAGEGLEVWREGMVDVLSNNLDGLGGNRTIDSRTVLARWRERVPGEALPDLAGGRGHGRTLWAPGGYGGYAIRRPYQR